MIKLSPRLEAIAKFAENGKRIIDVGTDHGYIPVYFAQAGTAERITAADINKAPLDCARKNAAEHGITDKIDFMLTDGLKGADETYDTVIIAGMGGETIISILQDAPWTKNGVRLILQPQTKIGELSGFLNNEGYKINDARLVKDTGKLYLVLDVSSGEGCAPQTHAGAYADRILLEKHDPLLPEYLDELIKKFTIRLAGLEASGNPDKDEYNRIKLALTDFKKMEEETEKW